MQPDLQTVYSAGSQDVAAQQNKVLRNTYLLLAVSLIPTVIGAAVGTNFVNFSFMRASPIMSMIIMMALFYGWIFMIEKNRNSALGVGLLLGFTAFMGLLLARDPGSYELATLWQQLRGARPSHSLLPAVALWLDEAEQAAVAQGAISFRDWLLRLNTPAIPKAT